MNKDFSRVLTLLRHEKGLHQEKVAKDLGVSQALLSHYENGKRECNLDFLVKVSKYYDVSIDYLLGQTVVPNYKKRYKTKDNYKNITMSGQIKRDKKAICETVDIIFSIILKCKNAELLNSATAYLNLCSYKLFRKLYSSNENNSDKMFSVSSSSYDELISSSIASANLSVSNELSKVNVPNLSANIIADDFPTNAIYLSRLIENCEEYIKGSR